jgi:hypothetical protein
VKWISLFLIKEKKKQKKKKSKIYNALTSKQKAKRKIYFFNFKKKGDNGLT